MKHRTALPENERRALFDLKAQIHAMRDGRTRPRIKTPGNIRFHATLLEALNLEAEFLPP